MGVKIKSESHDAVEQKEEAGRIAWDTPGIWPTKNEIAVDYYYALVD